jgi:hypothetical protein
MLGQPDSSFSEELNPRIIVRSPLPALVRKLRQGFEYLPLLIRSSAATLSAAPIGCSFADNDGRVALAVGTRLGLLSCEALRALALFLLHPYCIKAAADDHLWTTSMSFESDRLIPSFLSVAMISILATTAATFTFALRSSYELSFIVEVVLPMAVRALALGCGASLILLYISA